MLELGDAQKRIAVGPKDHHALYLTIEERQGGHGLTVELSLAEARLLATALSEVAKMVKKERR